jgi:hypothetical protein
MTTTTTTTMMMMIHSISVSVSTFSFCRRRKEMSGPQLMCCKRFTLRHTAAFRRKKKSSLFWNKCGSRWVRRISFALRLSPVKSQRSTFKKKTWRNTKSSFIRSWPTTTDRRKMHSTWPRIIMQFTPLLIFSTTLQNGNWHCKILYSFLL